MKKEIREERIIEQMKGLYDLSSKPDSGFVELYRNDATKAGGKLALSGQNRQMIMARNGFHAELSKCLPGSAPCSVLSCILALPEKPEDWQNPSSFSNILLWLLSERGWSFLEACPTAAGQPDMAAYLSQIDPQKRDSAQSEELWNESKAISKAQEILYRDYHISSDGENSNRIEDDTDNPMPPTPAFFRRCIITLLTKLDKTTEQGELEPDDFLSKLCKEEWHLSEDQLNAPVSADGALKCDSSDNSKYSLREILRGLVSICSDILQKADTAIFESKTPIELSAEAYGRYHESKKARKLLENKLGSKALLICSGNHLLVYLRQSLVALYQHVDLNKRDDSPSIDNDDLRVRINGRTKADTPTDNESKVPQFFNFSWAKLDLEKTGGSQYIKLKKQLCTAFLNYEKCLGNGMKLSKSCLEERIARIAEFSLMDTFGVHEDLTDISTVPVTLAPVIVYSIFKWCPRFSESQNSFTRIRVDTLFPPKGRKMAIKSIKDVVNDMWLFSNLCHVFKRYYKERYSPEVQDEWNAAFLTLSGYQRLYKNPNVLYDVECRLKEVNIDFPHSPYFKNIATCLEANRISLAHEKSNQIKEQIDRFHPRKAGEPGWTAVVRLLEKDCKRNDKPWLEQFEQKHLRYGYTPSEMLVFFENCFKNIVGQSSNWSYTVLCENEKYNMPEVIKDLEWRLSEETIALTVLEYTMRLMLEEQCSCRLYQWLTELVAYKYRNCVAI